jgi:hypothetical protein
MAHFAKIEDSVVTQVTVINNEVILDENGIEQESIGVTFCANLFGGEWVQTSYNGSFRGKYAGVGDTYDSELDIFKSPTVAEETTD